MAINRGRSKQIVSGQGQATVPTNLTGPTRTPPSPILLHLRLLPLGVAGASSSYGLNITEGRGIDGRFYRRLQRCPH